MDDLFAPPGVAWQPVSPQLRRLRRTVLVAWTVVLVAAAFVASWAFVLPRTWTVLAVVVLLALAVLDWWVVGRNARAWGYAERDEDLYVKHGAVHRELIAVPYGRMQYVDVNAGPLERMFGIATVRLHTASPGTNARIPGLPPAEAARLRDRLTELGESQAAGL